jgi:hypothetical protein
MALAEISSNGHPKAELPRQRRDTGHWCGDTELEG